jgi:hypothetical protein
VEGIELVPNGGDGCWQSGITDGLPTIASSPCKDGQSLAYLYFRVDDSYMYDEQDRAAELAVVFRDDAGCGQFNVEYDNCDPKVGLLAGAFRPTDPVSVGLTGTWRTARMILPQVRFVRRTNDADFRLCVTGGKARLTVREAIVRKLPGVQIKLPSPATRDSR